MTAEAAALASIGDHEGRWCWAVATGRIKGGPGEGPWQLEPGSHRKRPFSGSDVASLSHAAGEALWLWRHSWQCGPALQLASAPTPACRVMRSGMAPQSGPASTIGRCGS
jgi:hypothetical protein